MGYDMKFDKIAAAWANYRAHHVVTSIHPDDHMFKHNAYLDDYEVVGESALHVVLSALAISRKQTVYRIMDFGCGHGRIARYLRAAFPRAMLWCCDIDQDAAEFCAREFNAISMPSTQNFEDLDLPTGIDLIWVGSVFTHIDKVRMEALFDKLFAALGPGGLLIATFHGQYYYDLTKRDTAKAQAYAGLLQQFEDTGSAYMTYPNKTAQVGMVDWGVSIMRSDRVFELGRRHERSQMVMFSEQGWSNFHDVAAWAKR